MFIVLCSNVQTIYIYIYKKCIDTSLYKSNVNIVNNDLWPSTAMTRWEWIVWAYLLLIMSCSTVQNMHAYSSLRINKMLYRAGSQLQWKHCSKCGGGGGAHNGKAWELIMQIPQLQRNNNSGNSKTNHNTEGYCLAFAYLLDNYNLLIMPILFRTMSLCSYNNAHIRKLS